MKGMGAKIRYLRESRNMTQTDLADRIGISRSALNNWEHDLREPSVSMLNALARAFAVTVQDIVGDSVPIADNVFPVYLRKIPVYGSIGAGAPKIADDQISEYISTDSDADFAVLVDGDSMQPTISKGDLALIAKQDDVDNGQIAAVLIKDEESAVCKRIIHVPNGIMLISDNTEKYPPITYAADEVKILGRICQTLRRF